jgi:predicted  nucleic acid-binding Zn-ribbon protein
MDGDESRRISELEWRLNKAEREIKLADERIKRLEDAQKRAEQTILNLTSVVEALAAGRPMTSSGD